MEPLAPSLLRWTALCAVAEAVGMTAAAGAARTTGTGWVGLGGIVVAGLIEGTALGLAQAWPLGRWLPALRRGRYVVATVLVAGLGWAAGSAPSVLAADEGGPGPGVVVLLVGGAGLGLAMGTVLGAAQAVALRGAVPHPWRWIGANAAAWPLAMAVIFLGASSPRESWSIGWVLLDGTLTGVVAGAALGLVTWRFLPSLVDADRRDRESRVPLVG